jgi:hypothetical protein
MGIPKIRNVSARSDCFSECDRSDPPDSQELRGRQPDGIAQFLYATGSNSYAHSVFGESDCECSAESSAAARDERCLITQFVFYRHVPYNRNPM